MTQPNPKYIHLHSKKGAVDSICRHCFVTIATATDPSDLAESEQQHICDPWILKKHLTDIQTEVRQPQ